ncbi:MAG: CCA tRNA nucleotidyltransferase [Planctomycetaceae bacterium]|nr:CCA tRNA nucleotidyltransferase [Planctomycetaceae bacterium]
MSDVDSQRDFATDVVRQLVAAGFVALWAGGCVRDLMRGRTPKDYDVATDARPDQVREVFGRRRTVPVGESFGVILVNGPPKTAGQVEVATFRTEGAYADGRRPDSVTFATPQEDASRRDFTINGMFFDPLTDTLHDYVGGEADLGRGIVRAIGDAHARMSEDKLRMLRAVRFAATLDFAFDESTAAAVREMAPQITVVSWERITQEIKRMLVDPHRERAMRLCHELRLLAVIFPELVPIFDERKADNGEPRALGSSESTDPACEPLNTPLSTPAHQASTSRGWWRTLHILGNLEEPGFELAMATLLHTVPSPLTHLRRRDDHAGAVRGICRRLKLSNAETDHITWLVARQHALDHAPVLPLATLKRLLVDDRIGDLFQLARCAALAEQQDTRGLDFAAEYLARTPHDVLDPPVLINGADLQARGLAPGPKFKAILDTIRDAQLNEEISTHDEALAIVDRLAGGEAAPDA